MKSAEYFDFADEMCSRCLELSQKKNHDYADPDRREDDLFAVFANFTAVERLGICSTEQGFLVRMMDKIVRIANLVSHEHATAVVSESVKDTLDDLHNYSLLMAGFLECVKRHGRPTYRMESKPVEFEQ